MKTCFHLKYSTASVLKHSMTECETQRHCGVSEPGLSVCVFLCTSVSGRTQGTVHAPGLSVQTAALCVCGLPVGSQRSCACQGVCHSLPADTLVICLLRLMLSCEHAHIQNTVLCIVNSVPKEMCLVLLSHVLLYVQSIILILEEMYGGLERPRWLIIFSRQQIEVLWSRNFKL